MKNFAALPAICIFTVGLSGLTLVGCTNNPDPYYNPPPLPPYGSNPRMDAGAVGPMAPPPSTDGTY